MAEMKSSAGASPVTIVPGPVTAEPGSARRQQIEQLSGEKISTCFQCEKCANGCPMTFAMDIAPNQVMHSIQLGLIDPVLNSDTIWVCASCETCSTRCPNDIDIAHVMDTLRQLSTKQGVKPSQKKAPIFHRTFLDSVRRFGRMHEMSMAVEYTLKSEGLKGLSKQMSMGLGMMRKGKMKLFPGRLRAGKEVDTIFRTAKRK
jgi:heterodisulfide reductase subunit C